MLSVSKVQFKTPTAVHLSILLPYQCLTLHLCYNKAGWVDHSQMYILHGCLCFNVLSKQMGNRIDGGGLSVFLIKYLHLIIIIIIISHI